ncbi:MAG: porin [Deltaproteobacteria bacterium]
MLKRFLGFMIAAIVVACAVPAHAFMLGEESKGAKIKVTDESDLTIRIRLQPRIDSGDIITSKDGTSYVKDSDMYMRRVRLEMSGQAVKNLKYNLTLDADKWDKVDSKGATAKVALLYANINYTFMPEFSLEFGKNKLPYSRVSLTSSSAQLLIERPVSTEAAKKLFGGASDSYYQTALKAEGKVAEGIFGYALALADGWSNGETLYTGKTVFKTGQLIVGRIELSPPGWVEAKKSDAHLGKGKHLTLGVSAAQQNDIEYKSGLVYYDEDRKLTGIDVSAHYEGFTAQFERIGWTIDSSEPAVGKKEPKGWYAQAGYFIAGPDIEPVARYEDYDQNSKVANSKEKTTTVGLNWYPKGHSLKLGINRVHTTYESAVDLANDSSKDVYQVQGQFYF